MYIRRKVFSILTDEMGEERLYSVNETLLEGYEQREFGAHKRKQNRKIANAERYVRINANKADRAEKRSKRELERGNLEAAEQAANKAKRHATQSGASASQLSERIDNAAKTRKSIDSAEGLTLKREGAIHDQSLNLKRDIPNNQTTVTREVVAKNDVVPGTGKKVKTTTTTVIERDLNKPTSSANPVNATTNAQARAARDARRSKGVSPVQVTQTTEGYKGGVNGKKVVEYNTTKTLDQVKNNVSNTANKIDVAKIEAEATRKAESRAAEALKLRSKRLRRVADLRNKKNLVKGAKIGAGVLGGVALVGAGVHAANRMGKKKEN